jgi:hypothetical protein
MQLAAVTADAAADAPPPPMPPPVVCHAFLPLPDDLQVISDRMQKSVLVAVDRLVKNKKYDRIIKRTSKLMVRLHPLLLDSFRDCLPIMQLLNV